MPQAAMAAAMVVSTVAQLATRPKAPKLPEAPEPPTPSAPEIDAERREAISANRKRQGLQASILAGATEEPTVKTQTLLG